MWLFAEKLYKNAPFKIVVMRKIKRIERKVESFALGQLANWVARIFYIAGLTAIIPIILLFKFEKFFDATIIVACLCIFSSFVLLYTCTRSKRKALRGLGHMTLIPAILALIFAVFGRSWIRLIFGKYPQIGVEVERYLEIYVPSAWIITLIYLALGLSFLYWGQRVKAR